MVTKRELQEEYDALRVWIKEERSAGTEFSDSGNLPWDKMKKVLRALEIEKALQKIGRIEAKARKTAKRNDLAKFKDEVINHHNGQCDVCLMDNALIMVVHHVLPIGRGGGNDYDNLAVLCPNCHAIIHKMIDATNRGKDSTMGKWMDENYTRVASARLLELFFRYCKLGYR